MLWRIDTLMSPYLLRGPVVMSGGGWLLRPDFPGQAETDGFGGDHTLADLDPAQPGKRGDDLLDYRGRRGRPCGQAHGGYAFQPAELDVLRPVDQVRGRAGPLGPLHQPDRIGRIGRAGHQDQV